MAISDRFPKQAKEVRKLLSGLVANILADLKEAQAIEREPFALYALQLRLRLHEKEEYFRRQFLRGYEILLNELKRNE